MEMEIILSTHSLADRGFPQSYVMSIPALVVNKLQK